MKDLINKIKNNWNKKSNQSKRRIKTNVFLSFLLIGIVSTIILVSAASSKSVVLTMQSGHSKSPTGDTWYSYESINGSVKHANVIAHPFKDASGDYYYCVQPTVSIEDGLGYSFTTTGDSNTWNGLSDRVDAVVDEDAIKLIMYYGYGYTGRTAEYWYHITQTMIWRELYPTMEVGFANSCSFGSDSISCNKTNAYETYINQIQADIDKHGTMPSFVNQNLGTIPVGETRTLTDTKGVLNKFEVESCTNCSASISGNTLTVRATGVGQIKVNLVQKYDRFHTKETYVFTSVKNSFSPTFENKYCTSSTKCYTSSTTYYSYIGNNGVGVVFKQPTGSLYSLTETLSVLMDKNTSSTIIAQYAYGDYAHAVKSISLDDAKSFKVDTSGIVHHNGTSSLYDAISAARATWTGTW